MRLQDNEISVDRMDHAQRDEMARIAIARGRDRPDGGKDFQGWAILAVEDAAANGRTVRESGTEFNPFHADIFLNLPHDEDRRDIQKRHSLELAARAFWEDPP